MEGAITPVSLVSLSEDVLVEDGADGTVTVLSGWGGFDLGVVGEAVRAALRRMTLGPVALGNLAAAGADSAALSAVLDLLRGSVVRSLGTSEGRTPLLAINPTARSAAFAPVAAPPGARLRLSRFAVLRPAPGQPLLESANAPFTVALGRPEALHIASLLTTVSTVDRLVELTGVPAAVVEAVVAHLHAAGPLLVSRDGVFAEHADLDHWSPSGLLYHESGRLRVRAGDGEAVAAARPTTTAPVYTTRLDAPRIPLYRPDGPGRAAVALADLLETDLPQTDKPPDPVAARELSVEELGELLYRGARIRSLDVASVPSGAGHLVSRRPYYSVARLYELELYVVSHRCSGLAAGIYHYDPHGHALTVVDRDPGQVDALLDLATGAGPRVRPAAMVCVTARMDRLSWMFGGGAYATSLAHFGTLHQILHLCAKAMGIVVHAAALPATDLVDTALGLRWPAEVSVGACLLVPW